MSAKSKAIVLIIMGILLVMFGVNVKKIAKDKINGTIIRVGAGNEFAEIVIGGAIWTQVSKPLAFTVSSTTYEGNYFLVDFSWSITVQNMQITKLEIHFTKIVMTNYYAHAPSQTITIYESEFSSLLGTPDEAVLPLLVYADDPSKLAKDDYKYVKLNPPLSGSMSSVDNMVFAYPSDPVGADEYFYWQTGEYWFYGEDYAGEYEAYYIVYVEATGSLTGNTYSAQSSETLCYDIMIDEGNSAYFASWDTQTVVEVSLPAVFLFVLLSLIVLSSGKKKQRRRKGRFIGIIIAVGVALAIIIGSFYFVQSTSEATANAVQTIANAIAQSIAQLTTVICQILVFLTPVIIFVIPIYVLRNRDITGLIFGGVYGLLILLLLSSMGYLGSLRVSLMWSVIFYGSWVALSFIAGILTGVILYFIGIALFEVDKLIFNALFRRKKEKTEGSKRKIIHAIIPILFPKKR